LQRSIPSLVALICALLPASAAAARFATPDPLGFTPAPPPTYPLRGARLLVDPSDDLAGVVASQIRRSQPEAAQQLAAIADQPEAKRYGAWKPHPGPVVAKYLVKEEHLHPDEVPVLATYRLRHPPCGGVSDSRAEAGSYEHWYDDFARGIGRHRAIVFYEIDAVITAGCLSRHGLDVRVAEMRHAISALAALPHTVVYVDAGAADAQPPARVAHLLRRVGISKIQGFFTNATHQDWTSREIRYGQAISRRTGGRHFVVNTATNGRGPLVPHSRVRFGNSLHCNPRGRGLGPKPTGNPPTRYHALDGFFWIGNPGRSAGDCGHGDPPGGTFFLSYALMLIRNADYRIR